MDKAKIMLSAKEAELVANMDVILTKNQILQKVKWMLESLQSRQMKYVENEKHYLPNDIITVPPKISRGENYKGLPYLVLDFPRMFDKEDHLAVRTMFWWGNFFSITLHLAGRFKIKYGSTLSHRHHELQNGNFSICVNEDPWEHHFEENNYRPLIELDQDEFQRQLTSRSFLKLARQFSFDKWASMEDDLFSSFCQLTKWLSA